MRAVLFDWGNTLARFEWDDDLLVAGHRAGLAAVGRADEAADFTERFRTEIYPRLTPNDDYVEMLHAELGLEQADAEAFVVAEYNAWRPATSLAATAHALLDVDPFDAMFVGDRIDSDIRGAGDLGLITVQALWFAADEAPGGPEPDFMAFTPMDVLTAVQRLGAS